MLQEEIKFLLSEDTQPYNNNGISTELISGMDDFILEYSTQDCEISPEAFNIYKKFVSMKQNAPEGMKNELFSAMKNYIKEKISNNNYIDALFLYRFLIVKSKLLSSNYYEISEILSGLGQQNLSYEFIKLYEQYETNKPLRLLTVANFYNLQLKDYKTAIKYYENYLKIDTTKSVIYTIIGSLYAKAYGEISLKDQIYYFEKAHKLKPKERLTLHSLAFAYEKIGDITNANRYYQELLKNNPTPTDYYNYGAFLISIGEFQLGHKYFTKRFETGDINLSYPIESYDELRWDFKTDITDKTLLIHYEQGFGDTFMYCRFVPLMKTYAKKIIFVVQDEVYDLIKNSKFMTGIKLIKASQDLTNLKFDYHMALLDVPFVLKIRPSDIPNKDGYLKVSQAKTKDFAKKHIKPTKNIKVGIAYSGDNMSNYNGRDIDFTRFNRLFTMKNIDFYILTKDCNESGNFIPLGNTFDNFETTACAIKNMDIVISTDNVILNLAGALGVKTLGLFNKHTNFRWYKLNGEDIGWYKSVKPIQVEENNCWTTVFSEIIKILNEYTSEQ